MYSVLKIVNPNSTPARAKVNVERTAEVTFTFEGCHCTEAGASECAWTCGSLGVKALKRRLGDSLCAWPLDRMGSRVGGWGEGVK